MGSLDFAEHAGAAAELVAAAGEDGIELRTVGGIGIWQRLPDSLRATYEEVRPAPKDIDLLAPTGTSTRIRKVFDGGGWDADERLIAWRGNQRHRYARQGAGGSGQIDVDVFLGAPPLCHPYDVADPADSPPPALSASELALQKLQIFERNDKDLIDLGFLVLLDSTPESGPAGAIDPGRIAALLAGDWGFHHDAVANLDAAAGRAGELFGDGLAPAVGERIARLLEAIEAEPKTRRWKMRARVGTRKQWYEDVEEVDR